MKKISNLLILLSVAVLTLSSCSGGVSVGADSYVEKPMYDTKYVPAVSNGMTVYFDLSTGKKVKNYKEYEDAYYFYDGIARIKTAEDEYSFINSDFKPINKEKYFRADDFSEGIAMVVKKDGKIQGINVDGKVVFTLDNIESANGFSDGVAAVMDTDRKVGLIDKTGKFLIQPTDFIITKSVNKHGRLIAAKTCKTGMKWGVYDYNGKEIIPCEYDDIEYTFDENLFTVMQYNPEDREFSHRWGVIDSENKEIIPCRYTSPLLMMKNGISVFENVYNENFRRGLINAVGEEIIEPLFTDISLFSMGLAAARDPESKKYGYIDEEGKIVIKPQFLKATHFYPNGKAIVQNKNTEMWGVINKDGEYIINSDYDAISPLGEDMYIVEKNNNDFHKSGIINEEGKEIVPLTDLYSFPAAPEGILPGLVWSDFVDVDRIVNSMIENLKEINKHEISLPALSAAYDIDAPSLGNWGSTSFSKVNKLGVSSFFTIMVRRNDDSNDNNQDTYVGSYLIFEYDIDQSNRAYRKETEIYNAFVKKLNAPASVYNKLEYSGDVEFKCPILNNVKCFIRGRKLYLKNEEDF